MIGTIRKHSSWLWIIIAGLTIISFVYFMGTGPARNGNRSAGSGYGTLYGKEISAEDFARGQREFYFYYWLHNGALPDHNAKVKREEIDRETYVRLMLLHKAQKLGVHVSEDAVLTAANEFLRASGRNGQPMPLDQFISQVLAREGFTLADFQDYLRSDLTIQQLIGALGLAGTFVTPQEVGQLYDREHQEVSAQAVFFAASNYLANVSVTPAAVAQFYTNNLAAYRQPDQVQVNYVAFVASNYVAAAEQKIGKTNVTAQAEAYFNQHGLEAVPDAKTPAEAKAKIAEIIVRQRAMEDAKAAANEFAGLLFAQDPVKAENLTVLAKQKGLNLATTAPFSADGPEEFNAPAAFTKTAFKLSADEPLAGPVPGTEAVYIIALARQIPSRIPALEQIRSRVTQDFENHAATALAQSAGTNFQVTAAIQMAVGKTFAQSAIAAGQLPVVLSPFSLSSQEVPEAGDRVDLRQLKQAAFTTPIGHVSNFAPTPDGGFLLLVQSLMPMDQVKKNSELPQFLAQVRRGRQNEAFNLWLQNEANRELRNTPVYAELVGKAASR